MERNEFFAKTFGLTDEAIIDAVINVMSIKEFKKNELIFSAGEIPSNFYFNLKGIFRGFMSNEDGTEITDCLGFEMGAPIAAVNRIGEKAISNVEAVTDLTAVQLPMDDLVKLIQVNPDLVAIYNNLLQKALDKHWIIKDVRYKLSGAERYKWFLENYPGLIDQVRMKDVASFLGMTPVSLSRIRKELHEI